MKKSHSLLLLTTLLLTSSFEARAASTLISGGATIDYDAAAWATLAGGLNADPYKALVLNEFFDQAGVTARTGTQILTDEMVLSPSSTGLFHGLNGSTIVNLAGRTNQATTFSYEASDLTAHTGVIGLGGITRWDVNPLLGGGVLGFGDFTLEHHADRLSDSRSGWALTVHMPGGATAFDLLNVTTSATDYSLSISGDLAVSPEFAFLLSTPGDYLKDVGNFSFTAAAVPEPTRALLMMAGLGGLAVRRRRKSLPSP
jgi:hypothetical protein